MTKKTDTLYAQPRAQVPEFEFDAHVATVFPDMIKRSVPGYSHIISSIGWLAEHYAQPHSNIYDLGCSLGAATLSMRHRVHEPGVVIHAVDTSKPMLERAQQLFDTEASTTDVIIQCADITNLAIENASFVVLNFTLQFLAPSIRNQLLTSIYDGLNKGGAIVLSEKLLLDEHSLLPDLHHQFKRANGYSDLEISQKRQAIENVLVPETSEAHVARLQNAGFSNVECWFQSFNFSSFLAVK